MKSLWPSSLAIAIALFTATHQSAAQDCEPRDELSTCVASDNLWTHVGGGRWMSLAPTKTTPEDAVSFGFTPGFIYQPIGLRVSSPDPEGTTIAAVEAAVGATFHAGLGLTDDLQAHIAAPVVLFQEGASKADVIGAEEALPRSAIGDLRFGVTWSFLSREKLAGVGAGLAARFEIAAPTAQADAFSGYSSTTYAPGLSFDYKIGDFAFGADAAGRFRREVILATNVIGSQVALALGAGYDILDDGWLSVGVETFVLLSLSPQFDLQQNNLAMSSELVDGPVHAPMEWMVTTRTAGILDGDFRISVGGGSFIPTASDIAVTTPAFRLALALHYVFSYGDEDVD